MSGPAVCAKCRHHARGKAIAVQAEALTRRTGGKIRSGNRGGDYICAREGLTPVEPDPVSGFSGLPSGPDCRDLNPDGRCPYYARGLTLPGPGLTAAVCLALIVMFLVAIAIGGAS